MKKILIILSVIYLAGCAGTVPMKPEVRAKIHTVKVNKTVEAPLPNIYGSSDTAGAVVGGALGAAIASGGDQDVRDEKYLLSHNIDIKKIFRQDLIRELKSKGPFKVVSSGMADADIQINIVNYGFWIGGQFMNFDAGRPTLSVRLNFKDKNGKELWTGYDYITNLSSYTKVVSLDEVRANPRLAEQSLRKASKLVAKLLVADMEGRKVPEDEMMKVTVGSAELISSSK